MLADVLAPKGPVRLAIACSAGVAVVVVPTVFSEPVYAALRWVDRLAPMPGLSGLALLVLSPVAFLLLLAVIEWVLQGFGRSLQFIESEQAPAPAPHIYKQKYPSALRGPMGSVCLVT